jgi:molybdenum cofactor synthesis domain-containing protein
MIPLAEARAKVLAALPAPEVVELPTSGVLGLVLATDVRSPSTVPPFDNSAMDGYAVRHRDLAQIPCVLSVSEDVAAGHVAGGAVEAGTAIKIMTGAPIPAGADTVVRVEDTVPGESSVEILVRPEPGTAVRSAGGDVAAGDLVFGAGDVITARHLGVLAAVGVDRVQVYRRLRVAVVSTGDEVVPPSTSVLAPGQIRDSNRSLLSGLLAESGLEAVDYGIVGDDAAALRGTFARAARECDAVITSGGVSMGEYDLVKQVLTELGGVQLWKVAMQPAKPFAFGSIAGTPLFGLPGNPVSVFVAFEQFARPALLSMMGHRSLLRPRVQARLGEDVSTDPEKTVFLRVVVDLTPNGRLAWLAGGQASNVLSATARAEAFAVIPRGVADVSAGDTVELEMFRWSNE